MIQGKLAAVQQGPEDLGIEMVALGPGLHEERPTGDDQQHELERGDEREEHGGALPGLDGELRVEAGGVIHERTGSPAPTSFLPDPLPRSA